MKIDEQEQVSIWLVGNTGLRNPYRIHEGFKVFAQSPYVGKLIKGKKDKEFTKLLNDKGVIKNEEGKDKSGSHARKWRLMFEKHGFIYAEVKSKCGFKQKDIGSISEITPFGRIFLEAESIPSVQECFLRALGVEQYWLPNNEGNYSPLRWILAIMLELEKQTGSSEISRIEFSLWGQTTNPSYELNDVVNRILDLRQRRKKAPAKQHFDKKEIETRGKHYQKKNVNFLDYCDMNMRYLRISGILQRKGRGLIIAPAKHIIAESLAKTTVSHESMLPVFKELTNGAALPTDNLDVSSKVLTDLQQQLCERHITYDISDLSLTNVAEVNIARRRLESILFKMDEWNYATRQKDEWQEISDYMSLLINGGGHKDYDEDNKIEVPKDETPAYLEWTLWRAALAVDHMVNPPDEVRGFRLDSDFLPVSAAGGGKGDLYCEFENFMILTEVTMSTSSRQEAMEGEPVRRHVSDAVLHYAKPVYGMFIAVKIDTNTAETFRHGVWYAKGNIKQRLNIVPLTLAQFQHYFENMFKLKQVKPETLVDLLQRCGSKRDDLEAPDWQEYINDEVEAGVFGLNRLTDAGMVAENRLGQNQVY